MIEVQNLTKTYGPTRAVDGISFEIPKGEVVGFLGPNGAGKTTTMRILTCYLPADSGVARVAGYDTFTESIEVRRRIGYLPESAPVYSEMGIVEYLSFVAEIRGVSTNERKRKVHEVVERVGLVPMIQKDIGQLSKGYRQRVGLAATLLHDPEVLVLDEPTTGLDPNQIIEIRQLIRDIGREKTVILSTHILPEVEATCDRVLIINNGTIIASGSPDELTRAAAGESVSTFSIRIGEGGGSASDASQVESKLKEMSEVTKVRVMDPLKVGTVRYEITSHERDDIEERLFHVAVSSGWVLTELSSEGMTLEQAFTQLTLGGK